MPLVTPEKLLAVLLSHPTRGAKQVAIVTRTRPKMLVKSRVTKEPNPFWQGVERHATRLGTIGASYEAAVNRERTREAIESNAPAPDAFNPESLWDGKGIRHTRYTVMHADTGRIYLAMKPAQVRTETETGSAAVVKQDKWIDVATGRELDFENDHLADYLPPERKSRAQDVEHDVQWRVFALDSIVELRYGEIYVLDHAAPRPSGSPLAAA